MRFLLFILVLSCAPSLHAYGFNEVLSFPRYGRAGSIEPAPSFRVAAEGVLALVGDVLDTEKATFGGSEIESSGAESFLLLQTIAGLSTRVLIHDRFQLGLHFSHTTFDFEQDQGGDFVLEGKTEGFGLGASIGAIPWINDSGDIVLGMSLGIDYHDTEGDFEVSELSFLGTSADFNGDISLLSINSEFGGGFLIADFELLNIDVWSYVTAGVFYTWADAVIDDVLNGQNLEYDWQPILPVYVRGGLSFQWPVIHAGMDVALGSRSSFTIHLGCSF